MIKSELTFIKPLFGKEIEFTFYDIDETLANKQITSIYGEAIRLQKIFNFYDPESELSKLNKKRKINVSTELLEVLTKALYMSEQTNGRYDISLGKSIDARKKGEKFSTRANYKNISVKKDLVILDHEDVLIDLGSIAKGFIADRIAEFIKSKGIKDFSIDARGDIIFQGKNKHRVQIQHPRQNKAIKEIILQNEAVATSGDYNQFIKNYDCSHILNQKEIISATVVAQTLEEADLYATAFFVSDEKDQKKLAKNNQNIRVLLLTEDLKQIEYNDFRRLLP